MSPDGQRVIALSQEQYTLLVYAVGIAIGSASKIAPNHKPNELTTRLFELSRSFLVKPS